MELYAYRFTYCENDRKIGVKCRHPCCSSLQLHTNKAKYQTANSKNALK